VNNIGIGLADQELVEMTARASLAIAYGEGLSNLLQPFFLLLVLPVMTKGVKLQARDVMGFLVIPFMLFMIVQSILVLWVPL
jgi:short-chain fatty acids transporter